MTDQVQKKFVKSFIDYLKKEVESRSLTPDAQESVEVAMQCLQAAYDIVDEEEAVTQSQQPASATGDAVAEAAPVASTGDVKDIDLFELFQSVYIERNPENLQMAETIKNEGNRLMKDGKYNEALLQYNRAITFDPKNPIFYCNRAAAYIRLGENARAVVDCKSALVYNVNYSKAYGRLGIAYSNLGKYVEAQQAYERAIELEPDNQDYRNNLEVARNARSQVPLAAIPQLSEGINAMLSNPNLRNLFNSTDIDLEQLQSMSQNPMIMNMMSQVLAGLQGQGGPAASPDLLQLFQTLTNQLGNPAGAANGGGAANDAANQQNRGGGNANQPGEQPPSS